MSNHRPYPRAVLLLTGAVCFIVAIGFLLFLVAYVTNGAGVQFFGFFSGGIVLGWIHVMGLLIAAGISFCLGVGCCAYGITTDSDQTQSGRSSRGDE